ncbi:uncharacterized protein BDW47DRAFT_99739 [Aspergillus candidus]|uniref:Uncharacterized protein n=1 Tax=Aspergillus candidus TaxID=41067 RepID=A0A2I2FKT2_ASPCN|nr:hypothetical protein BDW47DRAFT_99739 [Aspergillus candidus]PLB41231.1 hypothetical protein BDW47DRAFT_99739 [Aspergillus candidus]
MDDCLDVSAGIEAFIGILLGEGGLYRVQFDGLLGYDLVDYWVDTVDVYCDDG